MHLRIKMFSVACKHLQNDDGCLLLHFCAVFCLEYVRNWFMNLCFGILKH